MFENREEGEVVSRIGHRVGGEECGGIGGLGWGESSREVDFLNGSLGWGEELIEGEDMSLGRGGGDGGGE